MSNTAIGTSLKTLTLPASDIGAVMPARSANPALSLAEANLAAALIEIANNLARVGGAQDSCNRVQELDAFLSSSNVCAKRVQNNDFLAARGYFRAKIILERLEAKGWKEDCSRDSDGFPTSGETGRYNGPRGSGVLKETVGNYSPDGVSFVALDSNGAEVLAAERKQLFAEEGKAISEIAKISPAVAAALEQSEFGVADAIEITRNRVDDVYRVIQAFMPRTAAYAAAALGLKRNEPVFEVQTW